MLTREQEQFVSDRATESLGPVHVRDGFTDGHVDVTVPGGQSWRVSYDASHVKDQINHSVDWSQLNEDF
jgi:hypothetical protein